MGGGTDLAGQVDRGIRTPTLLVDLRESGLAEIAEEDGGLRIGASVTLAGLAAEARLEPYEAVRAAASLAASPLLRNVGTVGGNLASTRAAGTTAARSGTAGSAAATPATRRSATTASTTSSRATASRPTRPISRPRSRPAARPWSCAPGTARARCRCSSSIATRPRTTARCSPSRRASSSPPCGCPALPTRLPTSASASAPRSASRSSRWRRRDAATRSGSSPPALPTSRASSIPQDPLAGLPGNPQTGWKRTLLATLVERAVARVG